MDGNIKNASIPPETTGIIFILALNKDSVGETVSLRSEADQLPSQLITVTVTSEIDCYNNNINMFLKHTTPGPYIQPLLKLLLSPLAPVL